MSELIFYLFSYISRLFKDPFRLNNDTSFSGGPVHIPFTETFVAILEAVFAIQEGLIKVLREAGLEILSTEDWYVCTVSTCFCSQCYQLNSIRYG